MSSNKNALIRYKTIDNCLRNRTKLWTLEDLIDACSDALYEYEGKYDLVSKRTVQLDIQNMRSEKLGYNAPIEVFQKKFYRYSEPDFSIKNIPVNENDIKVMNDAVQILKQFKETFFVYLDFNFTTIFQQTKMCYGYGYGLGLGYGYGGYGLGWW